MQCNAIGTHFLTYSLTYVRLKLPKAQEVCGMQSTHQLCLLPKKNAVVDSMAGYLCVYRWIAQTGLWKTHNYTYVLTYMWFEVI